MEIVNVLVKNCGSRESKEWCLNQSDIKVIGYTDKSPIAFSEYEGDVYSTYDAIKLYKDGVIDRIIFPDGIELDLLRRMVNECIYLGVKKDDLFIIKPSIHNGYEIVKSSLYTRLKYIEFHVADHCNLNCKGCVHFSPLVKEPQFMDYEVMKADLIQLHKKVELIDKIHILGGEPLLNKELYRFVRLVKEIYPYTETSIVTNGLLLDKMSDKLIKAILETNTWINVSVYEPMINRITDIAKHFSLMGIKIRFTDTITNFSIPLDEKGGHARGAKRISCKCPNLYKGKLSVCPIICYLPYFNNYFGLNMNADDGLIDIYDDSITYEDIVEELQKVRNLCDKCVYISQEHFVERKWGQSDSFITLEDYMVK